MVYNYCMQPISELFYPYFVVAEDFVEGFLVYSVRIKVVPQHEDTLHCGRLRHAISSVGFVSAKASFTDPIIERYFDFAEQITINLF